MNIRRFSTNKQCEQLVSESKTIIYCLLLFSNGYTKQWLHTNLHNPAIINQLQLRFEINRFALFAHIIVKQILQQIAYLPTNKQLET